MTEVTLVSLNNMINGKSKVSEELNLRQVIYQQTLISWQKSGCRNTQAPLFLYDTRAMFKHNLTHMQSNSIA